MFKAITYYLLSIFIVGLLYGEAYSQSKISSVNNESRKISKLYKELEESLQSKDEVRITGNYESLAKAYLKESNYIKSEEYYSKALDIYTKRKQDEDVARASRGLAKAKERLGKYEQAAQHYELAQQKSNDNIDKSINSNDAKRVSSFSNPQLQSSYSNSNIQYYKQKGQKEEIVDAYMQQAISSTQLNNSQQAIDNYSNALKYTDNNSNEQVQIKDELATIYLNTNQTEKAKEIKNELIVEAQQQQDVTTEIQQKQSLATILMQEADNNTEALQLLQDSYSKAIANSNTLEAKKSLELLIDYYRNKGDYSKSIQLYDQFLKKLDALVKSDSSLLDYSLIAATEEKIKQLEKEKKLQDELIAETKRFNYMLAGAILLIVLFLLLMVRAFYSVKRKNKEIALQSLRREMNPHFIFNSLNSVNQFIAENKELEANKYLSSYSQLMRSVMENSNKDFILLSKEIELIKKYLALEHLRFKEKFDYRISLDEKLDAESIYIPNMLLQPQLENAIWHGLRYKDDKGTLTLNITLNTNAVCVCIEDNGIGLTKSKELKTLNQKAHDSRGLNNTMERIYLLNELYHKNIQLTITEKEHQTGTIVTIVFPVINKL